MIGFLDAGSLLSGWAQGVFQNLAMCALRMQALIHEWAQSSVRLA
jgi:predicted ATPase